MTSAAIKQAWQAWQEANRTEAAQLRSRFATKAIEHGFAKAERYLVTAMAERLQIGWHDVARAIE